MHLPSSIHKIIGDRAYTVDTVGMSGSQVICFEDMVLKMQPRDEEAEHELQMMSWLADRLPVPKIICAETKDDTSYLLMSRLGGSMACSSEFLENPKLLVRLLAEGLQMLWKADAASCPLQHSIDEKLMLAEKRVLQNLCNIEDAEPDTYGDGGFASPRDLLGWLKQNKPSEELVFSHGDFCLPNVFLKRHTIGGFIDLGRSGVGGRYQDIALCYRSLKHNYDGRYGGKKYPGFHPDLLFDELSIVPDWGLIEYYILLDELF